MNSINNKLNQKNYYINFEFKPIEGNVNNYVTSNIRINNKNYFKKSSK